MRSLATPMDACTCTHRHPPCSRRNTVVKRVATVSLSRVNLPVCHAATARGLQPGGQDAGPNPLVVHGLCCIVDSPPPILVLRERSTRERRM